MSQPAKKRPAPPSAAATDEARDQEGSGRFVIAEQRPSNTMLPPTSPAAESAQALDALPLLELEPDASEEAAEPKRGIVSGVFANRSAAPTEARDDELENAVASMQAYYRESERQQHERAQLVIEDLSFLPENPYGASSLIPPARKPIAFGKVLGFVAAAVALGTGAWFLQRQTSGTHDNAAPVASAVAIAPAVQVPAAAPRASQEAAKSEVPKLEATQPAQPIAVAATPAPQRAQNQVPAVGAAITTARKPAVASVAHEAPAHEATAQAALRAVLAGPASDSPAVGATDIPAAANTTASAAPIEPAPAATDTTADALGALPDLPAREDVVAGFERVREELSKCAADKHGTVQIDATIANSGRVSRALIDGVFKGTVEGSCMARAARAARFPQFAQSSLSVRYPIAL